MRARVLPLLIFGRIFILIGLYLRRRGHRGGCREGEAARFGSILAGVPKGSLYFSKRKFAGDCVSVTETNLTEENIIRRAVVEIQLALG